MELNNIKSEITAAKAALEVILEQKAFHESQAKELDDLTSQIELAKNELQETRETNEKIETEISRKEVSLAELIEAIVIKHKESQEATEEAEEGRRSLEDVDTLLEYGRSNIKDLKEQLEEEESKLSATNKALEESELKTAEANKTYNETVEKIEKDINVKREELKEIVSTLEWQGEHLSEIRAENKLEAEEGSMLSEKIEALVDKINKIKEKKRELKKEAKSIIEKAEEEAIEIRGETSSQIKYVNETIRELAKVKKELEAIYKKPIKIIIPDVIL